MLRNSFIRLTEYEVRKLKRIIFVSGTPYRFVKKQKDGTLLFAPMSEDEYVRSDPKRYARILKAANDLRKLMKHE